MSINKSPTFVHDEGVLRVYPPYFFITTRLRQVVTAATKSILQKTIVLGFDDAWFLTKLIGLRSGRPETTCGSKLMTSM